MRWITGVRQVIHLRHEDARAGVIELADQRSRRPLDWYTEGPPQVYSADPTWHMYSPPADGGPRNANG